MAKDNQKKLGKKTEELEAAKRKPATKAVTGKKAEAAAAAAEKKAEPPKPKTTRKSGVAAGESAAVTEKAAAKKPTPKKEAESAKSAAAKKAAAPKAAPRTRALKKSEPTAEAPKPPAVKKTEKAAPRPAVKASPAERAAAAPPLNAPPPSPAPFEAASTATTPPPATPAHPPVRSRVVLMIRDPEWLYAYWEISARDRATHAIGQPQGAPPLLLRVHDMGHGTEATETGQNFDVTVIPDAGGWYVHVPKGGGHWGVALGYLDYEGRFVAIAHSNIVTTPSPILAEWSESTWGPALEEGELELSELESEELGPGGSQVVRRAARIFAHLRGGQQRIGIGASEQRPRMGASEQIPRMGASEQVPRIGASEQFARLGASEQVVRIGASEQVVRMGASEQLGRQAAAGEKKKSFWLQVHTELILYGATEPDASVTVQGQPVRLRPDGTFTLRYALPDGEQVIPVHAINADGDMEETITPIVTKRTV